MMKEDKFKLTLTPPLDKKGFTVKLDIQIEQPQILYLKHYPDLLWYFLGFIAIVGIAIVSLLLASQFWILCLVLLAILLFGVVQARAFLCIIDKTTGMIFYHQSGVLMTTVGEQKREHSISQIKRLEMHRYVKGGPWSWSWSGVDTFQVFLILEKANRIPLSPANLDFRECQEFKEQILYFLGNEVPVKAID